MLFFTLDWTTLCTDADENCIDYEAAAEDFFPFEDENFTWLDVPVTENEGSVELSSLISIE